MRLPTALLTLVVVLCFVMPARAGQSILFLGDSLTAGLGVEPEEAYPHLVGQLLAADGIAVQIINGGQSGSTTASALSRLNWYARAKPDILFLALGANDGLRGLTIEEMGKNLEAVIIAAQGRGMRVLLAGMELPPNYGPEYTDAFRRVYADLADRYQIPLLPFLLAGVGGVATLNQADGIHPNAEGHQRIARHVLPFLKAHLRPQPATTP